MSSNIEDGRSLVRAHPHRQEASIWRFAMAGLSASLVGLGLARFAYTPLIPALIAAGWFNPADVVYLGAANLAGYLAGAVSARPIGARFGAAAALRLMMVLATLSCFASSAPVAFAWFFAWRFLAGLAGGVIMVLAASSILPHTAPSRRGLVGGVIFSGVGLGIAASGTLVPLLLQHGLRESWIGLGLLSGLLTLISWSSWPKHEAAAHTPASPPRVASRAIRLLLLQYGLNAAALVPHMVFLVDFVARGLGQGIDTGARYWVIYGLGAIVGPLITGTLADRAGFARALRLSFLVEALAVSLPLFGTHPSLLAISSLIVGGFTPGIVPLALGRVHELLPGETARQRAAWSHATTSFALFQAAAAYGFSFLFAQGEGGYLLLFGLGGGAVLLAFLLELVGAAIGFGKAAAPPIG